MKRVFTTAELYPPILDTYLPQKKTNANRKTLYALTEKPTCCADNCVMELKTSVRSQNREEIICTIKAPLVFKSCHKLFATNAYNIISELYMRS